MTKEMPKNENKNYVIVEKTVMTQNRKKRIVLKPKVVKRNIKIEWKKWSLDFFI